MPEFRTFEDLECWQACREVHVFTVRQVIPVLPKDEKYRLADQLLRASRSGTANIAEGYGRFHYLDTAKFCSNARGSVYEVLDHLITAEIEMFMSPELLATGRQKVETAIRLLNGYIHYLQNRAKTPNEPKPE